MFWIALKEKVFLGETESQSFKALIEKLHVLLMYFLTIDATDVFRCTLVILPFKDVPCIVNLILLHLRSICP